MRSIRTYLVEIAAVSAIIILLLILDFCTLKTDSPNRESWLDRFLNQERQRNSPVENSGKSIEAARRKEMPQACVRARM